MPAPIQPIQTEPTTKNDYQLDSGDYARPANTLNIHLGEHAGVVATTGAGKTFFTMKGLLEYFRLQYPHVPRYILDSTDDPKMEGLVYNPLIIEGNHVPDLLRSSEHTQIWKPANSKIPSAYNEWFNKLNDSRRPAIIVIDEIASITSKGLAGLETLFKQMRKHGGTVIAESQRMAGVDTDIFSQLTHFFQFFINPEEYDLRQSRTYLGMSKEEQRQPLNPYGFFYRNTRNRTKYQEFRDYKHFFADTIVD